MRESGPILLALIFGSALAYFFIPATQDEIKTVPPPPPNASEIIAIHEKSRPILEPLKPVQPIVELKLEEPELTSKLQLENKLNLELGFDPQQNLKLTEKLDLENKLHIEVELHLTQKLKPSVEITPEPLNLENKLDLDRSPEYYRNPLTQDEISRAKNQVTQIKIKGPRR